MNLPTLADELQLSNAYRIYDKEKWALQLISERLKNKFSRFDAKNSV